MLKSIKASLLIMLSSLLFLLTSYYLMHLRPFLYKICLFLLLAANIFIISYISKVRLTPFIIYSFFYIFLSSILYCMHIIIAFKTFFCCIVFITASQKVSIRQVAILLIRNKAGESLTLQRKLAILDTDNPLARAAYGL